MALPSPASIEKFMVGKKTPPAGKVPSIVLHNPKYKHNVACVLRIASCYSVKQLWFTGDRVRLQAERGERLPREERMRGYKDVDLVQFDQPFDCFPKGTMPVAIEVRAGSQSMLDFEHPENAVYVFGPEDGSLPKTMVQYCHHFVIIPTVHCLNLATAVSAVLYDRMLKRHWNGLPSEVKSPLGSFDTAVDGEVDAAGLGLFDGKKD